MIKLKLRKMT